jgi:hypothetical protein
MDETSIVTPRDLDAAIRTHRTRQWDVLWADARRPRLGREWVLLIAAGSLVALQVAVLITVPSARSRFMESLSTAGLLLSLAFLLFGVYVSSKTRQVNALRKLLHGVLAESAPFSTPSLDK